MRLPDGTHYNPDGALPCAQCGAGSPAIQAGGSMNRARCTAGCLSTRWCLTVAEAITEWNDAQERIRKKADKVARAGKPLPLEAILESLEGLLDRTDEDLQALVDRRVSLALHGELLEAFGRVLEEMDRLLEAVIPVAGRLPALRIVLYVDLAKGVKRIESAEVVESWESSA